MKYCNDFMIRLVSLPSSVPGMAVQADDFINIFINEDLPFDKQLEAVKHEVRHIELDHFYDDRSVSEIEDEVRRPEL